MITSCFFAFRLNSTMLLLLLAFCVSFSFAFPDCTRFVYAPGCRGIAMKRQDNTVSSSERSLVQRKIGDESDMHINRALYAQMEKQQHLLEQILRRLNSSPQTMSKVLPSDILRQALYSNQDTNELPIGPLDTIN